MKKLASFILSTLTSASLMAAPQAVVFDFGGVMAGKQNRELVVDFIQASFQLSKKEFEKINQEKRLALKQGKTDEEFWTSYAKEKKIALPADWSDSFKVVMRQAIGANPEMYVLVDELKEQGTPVGLLSNVNQRIGKILRELGFYQPFDPCLLSYEIGIEKPDLKIYEFLLKELNLPAQEVVFIDDKQENIEAAKQLGIDAILFESKEQIQKELIKRGALE